MKCDKVSVQRLFLHKVFESTFQALLGSWGGVRSEAGLQSELEVFEMNFDKVDWDIFVLTLL